MSRRCGPGDGFALIEALATLALSSLVFLTLVIATGLVTRNSARVAQHVEAVETPTSGLAALRRDIGEIRLVRNGNAESKAPFLADLKPTRNYQSEQVVGKLCPDSRGGRPPRAPARRCA